MEHKVFYISSSSKPFPCSREECLSSSLCWVRGKCNVSPLARSTVNRKTGVTTSSIGETQKNQKIKGYIQNRSTACKQVPRLYPPLTYYCSPLQATCSPSPALPLVQGDIVIWRQDQNRLLLCSPRCHNLPSCVKASPSVDWGSQVPVTCQPRLSLWQFCL